MKNLRVVEEHDTMAYSLYMGDKKVRTVTQEELADADRKMAVSRLIHKAEKYWGTYQTELHKVVGKHAFADIKHPGRTYPIEQWPDARYPEPDDTEDILDPELFEWEEED